MSMKEQQAKKEFCRLNEEFGNRQLFFENIRGEMYFQIEKVFGIDIRNSLFVSWLPEGGDFVSCCIVGKNKKILFLDVNLKNSDLSICEESSLDDYERTMFFKKLKPWDPIRIAFQKIKEK